MTFVILFIFNHFYTYMYIYTYIYVYLYVYVLTVQHVFIQENFAGNIYFSTRHGIEI